MVGIRWARNRMTHSRAITVERNYGTVMGQWILGLGSLGTVDAMHWVSSSTVPIAAKLSYDTGRADYQRFLEGNPMVPTIMQAARWVHRSVNELDR